MDDTPDLTTYRLVHRAMRESGDRLAAAVAGLAEGDVRRARALRRWYDGFAGELQAHHTVEDEIFFPALAREVPAFAAYEEDLAADHEHLDGVMHRLGRALTDLAAGRAWAARHAEAVAESAELARFLSEHLGAEDEDVVPLFARHFSAAAYEALDRQALRQLRPRQLLFTLPWVGAACTEEERGTMLASAPAALVLVWRLSRRRYERRTAVAFASPAPSVQAG